MQWRRALRNEKDEGIGDGETGETKKGVKHGTTLRVWDSAAKNT